MSKSKHFIKQGLFEAELFEYFQRELVDEGFSDIEVRPTTKNTEIVIKAIRSTKVIGTQGRRAKELKLGLCKRFNLKPETIKIKVEKVGSERGLDATIQAEEIKQRLLEGMAVRKVCYRVLRNVMFNNARGCEIIVTGKLRAQRAKAMKFRKGNIIRVGNSSQTSCSSCVRHVKLRQGVLGVRVKIVLPFSVLSKRMKLESSVNPSQIVVKEPKTDMAIPKVYQEDVGM